jgi:hypothetical protein
MCNLLRSSQAGIQLYLQRHALGNGTMPDAVRAIAEALLTRGVQVSQRTLLLMDTSNIEKICTIPLCL